MTPAQRRKKNNFKKFIKNWDDPVVRDEWLKNKKQSKIKKHKLFIDILKKTIELLFVNNYELGSWPMNTNALRGRIKTFARQSFTLDNLEHLLMETYDQIPDQIFLTMVENKPIWTLLNPKIHKK